jgi:hypothetical protein
LETNLSSEEVPSTSLSPLLANSEWALVAKGVKQVPLPDFVLSSSPYVLQGGSARVEKGKGSDFAELTGCKGGGVARSGSLVNQPCMDVDLFS